MSRLSSVFDGALSASSLPPPPPLPSPTPAVAAAPTNEQAAMAIQRILAAFGFFFPDSLGHARTRRLANPNLTIHQSSQSSGEKRIQTFTPQKQNKKNQSRDVLRSVSVV